MLNIFFSSLSHKSAILAASPECVLTLQGNSFSHPARFELDGRQIVKFKTVLALFLRLGFSGFPVTLPSKQSSSKQNWGECITSGHPSIPLQMETELDRAFIEMKKLAHGYLWILWGTIAGRISLKYFNFNFFCLSGLHETKKQPWLPKAFSHIQNIMFTHVFASNVSFKDQKTFFALMMWITQIISIWHKKNLLHCLWNPQTIISVLILVFI